MDKKLQKNSVKGVINKAIAPVKLRPSMESETIDEIFYGTIVEVIEDTDSGWYLMQLNYSQIGYIDKDSIITINERVDAWQSRENYVICRNFAHVCQRPNSASRSIILLTEGCIVKQTGIEETNNTTNDLLKEKWERVELVEGEYGWILHGFANRIYRLSMAGHEKQLRTSIVNTALHYRGTQFRHNGRSSFGIDSIGLALVAYGMNGYTISGNMLRNKEYLKPINKDEVNPGDFYIFKEGIGISLGGGNFIHASEKVGYVLINSTDKENENYYEECASNLIGAATILGSGVL